MSLFLNPIVWSVILLMGLSIARMNVVLALLCAALVAGMGSGLDLQSTLSAFGDGLGGGANQSSLAITVSYKWKAVPLDLNATVARCVAVDK